MIKQKATSREREGKQRESCNTHGVKEGGGIRENTGALAPQNPGIHFRPHQSWVPTTVQLVSEKGEGCWEVGMKGCMRGNFLAVQWLGLCAPTAGGTGSIPGRGTKILQALGRKKEREGERERKRERKEGRKEGREGGRRKERVYERLSSILCSSGLFYFFIVY